MAGGQPAASLLQGVLQHGKVQVRGQENQLQGQLPALVGAVAVAFWAGQTAGVTKEYGPVTVLGIAFHLAGAARGKLAGRGLGQGRQELGRIFGAMREPPGPASGCVGHSLPVAPAGCLAGAVPREGSIAFEGNW